MQQLKLFHIEEPEWINITTEWLLNYLQSEYPEMKFKLFAYADGTNEIEQTFCKKVICKFSIENSADLDIWQNPVLIHMDTRKLYGNWGGFCEAVNSMEEFKSELPGYIKSCKESAENYKKMKEVKNER